MITSAEEKRKEAQRIWQIRLNKYPKVEYKLTNKYSAIESKKTTLIAVSDLKRFEGKKITESYEGVRFGWFPAGLKKWLWAKEGEWEERRAGRLVLAGSCELPREFNGEVKGVLTITPVKVVEETVQYYNGPQTRHITEDDPLTTKAAGIMWSGAEGRWFSALTQVSKEEKSAGFELWEKGVGKGKSVFRGVFCDGAGLLSIWEEEGKVVSRRVFSMTEIIDSKGRIIAKRKGRTGEAKKPLADGYKVIAKGTTNEAEEWVQTIPIRNHVAWTQLIGFIPKGWKEGETVNLFTEDGNYSEAKHWKLSFNEIKASWDGSGHGELIGEFGFLTFPGGRKLLGQAKVSDGVGFGGATGKSVSGGKVVQKGNGVTGALVWREKLFARWVNKEGDFLGFEVIPNLAEMRDPKLERVGRVRIFSLLTNKKEADRVTREVISDGMALF